MFPLVGVDRSVTASRKKSKFRNTRRTPWHKRGFFECLEDRFLLAGLPAQGHFDYVLVTNDALSTSFQPLIAEKVGRGVSATIVTTSYIYANYAGTETHDNQDRIRQFVADAHVNWGTKWLLLGGDVEVVPVRGVYATCSGVTESNLPTDLYYACLDGPWNRDGDSLWGETTDGAGGKDVDLVAEVYVGRAPVSNATEAANFVRKTIQYETTRAPNRTTAVWLGEQLDGVPTWGSGSGIAIKNQCLPADWNVIEHYDSATSSWSGSQLIGDLNASPHLVNSLGHASSTYDSRIGNSDVAALTNAFPYFLYSQGCDAGSFDTTDVSIAEQHVTSAAGAFAVVMNTRKGWYAPGGSLNYSHNYDIEFWDAVFNEGKPHLGQALEDSREDNILDVGSYGANRWVYFETTLFGDPETSLQVGDIAEIRGSVWSDMNGDGEREANEPGLGGELVFADTNGNGFVDRGGQTIASSDVPKPIAGTNTITSTIATTGLAGLVTDVDVTLNITHDYNPRVQVCLVSPSGTRILLVASVAGGTGFVNTALDDDAATPVLLGSGSFTGTFRPVGGLAKLNGEDPNGTWTLKITNGSDYFSGTLNGWSLQLSYAEPSATTDADGVYAIAHLPAAAFDVRHLNAAGTVHTAPAGGDQIVTLSDAQIADNVNFLVAPASTVNHAPAGTAKTVTTLEDHGYTFVAADFGFTDPSDSPANGLLAVKITSLPGLGLLSDNGTAVTAGQYVSLADITGGKLVYTPAANASGAGYTSFTFQVQDDGGTANGGADLDPTAKTMTLTVTAVNDAPAGTAKTVTTLEDHGYTFVAADFGFSDASDSPANGLLAVKITSLPGLGLLSDNGTAVTAGQYVSLADVTGGKLVYTPAANASGAGYASFTFQVQDDGGTANGGADLDPTAKTMTLTVTAVNDAPAGTAKTVTTLEDHGYTFVAADFWIHRPQRLAGQRPLGGEDHQPAQGWDC